MLKESVFFRQSFCGSVIPPTVYASGSNVIDVVLQTSGSSELPGFKLYYEMIPAPTISPCIGHVALTAAQGILYASPPDSYFNSQACSWGVTVATGKRVGIFFQWFQTESCCDKLGIKDLATSASLGDPLYSGEKAIPLLTSSGNSVNISFSTDGSVLDLGFQIFYFTAN
ncbi:deleted in malignant brain tumors 1 protein-like [Macrobrachium nipponense]|uniref:deleted in malignant brain tumors 1 protein-like n=1 Tax=Macrobrachium nipponense TaxID=159736 RepID=UPI0030C7D7DD